MITPTPITDAGLAELERLASRVEARDGAWLMEDAEEAIGAIPPIVHRLRTAEAEVMRLQTVIHDYAEARTRELEAASRLDPAPATRADLAQVQSGAKPAAERGILFQCADCGCHLPHGGDQCGYCLMLEEEQMFEDRERGG